MKNKWDKEHLNIIFLGDEFDLSSHTLKKRFNKLPVLSLDEHPKTKANLESSKYKYNSDYNLYAPIRTIDSIKEITEYIDTSFHFDNFNFDIEELLKKDYDPLFRFLCVCSKCKKIWFDHELKYINLGDVRYHHRIFGGGVTPIIQYNGLCTNCNSVIIKFNNEYNPILLI